ncbi:MAG TPA: substrate-binding domain-containing protein [Fimbriimonadaceae bacterium]|nr:substrate-binding domain-containing protein [Fimbriimonadaceae bacterium]
MKARAISILTAALLIAALGCGSKDSGNASGTNGSEPAPSGKSEYKIAVIPKGSTHEFWKAVKAGAESAGKELGVEVIWKGPMKEDDRESQIKVVEDFTTQQVSGIVLAPLDDTALRPPVENAVRSNIPVVIIDSDLKGGDTVSFVATDNFKGGQMAGEELARLLGGKGRVVMLRYQEGSASTNFREEGFLDAIKKHPEIEVVSANQYAGATTESAQKAAENLLAPLKKDDGSLGVDGIFTPNESSTFGMLRVLQDSQWAGKVKFVGFDASQKLVDGLKAGELQGLILQNPEKMGYLGVKTMVEHLKGTKVEKRIDTGAVLVTQENMEQPDVAKLLAPPKE